MHCGPLWGASEPGAHAFQWWGPWSGRIALRPTLFSPTVCYCVSMYPSAEPYSPSLIQVSSNHSHFSLEPCASAPSACASVVALLDPACDHK